VREWFDELYGLEIKFDCFDVFVVEGLPKLVEIVCHAKVGIGVIAEEFSRDRTCQETYQRDGSVSRE
jgi:hypothetical protein